MFKKFFDKFSTWNTKQVTMKIPYPTLQELNNRGYTGEKPIGTVIAFYTKDTFYELEQNRLVKSAEALKLPIQTVAVNSAGSWVKNAGLKPSFVLEQRKKLHGPLLYVDVDAVFHNNPWDYLENINTDIAVYYHSDGRLGSGTILINDTPEAIEILTSWKMACENEPEKWDQVALEEILSTDYAKKRYSVTVLPVFLVASRLACNCST